MKHTGTGLEEGLRSGQRFCDTTSVEDCVGVKED